jgi:menaquinone-dependent protoporphyrinogen oxidase
MKPLLILYATCEGHTRRIAQHIADTLRSRGFSSELIDVAEPPMNLSLQDYGAAIIAASVHRGKHEAEMLSFVKTHVKDLENMPAAFLSVSLSEAGAEDKAAPAKRRTQAAADVQRMIDGFLSESGWHPSAVRPVAGALLYSKYNFLLRLIMKRIARQAGGDTDTSRDYEYTDWKSLDEFVCGIAEAAARSEQLGDSSAPPATVGTNRDVSPRAAGANVATSSHSAPPPLRPE